MPKPRVCVLRAAGTNCDRETAFAFVSAGAQADFVHVNRLLGRQKRLEEYQILAIPGGFTYGDDIAAGKILANELRYKLADELRQFIQKDKLIIGICNGFQILVKAGLLPGAPEFTQEASLIINDSGKFEDRWVYLRTGRSKCVWTKGLAPVVYLPVAHGEGKFVAKDKRALEKLKRGRQIVFQYSDESGAHCGYPANPNGSLDDIAGICDATGRVMGLMPHPERHIQAKQHPRWTAKGKEKSGNGLGVFLNGVNYFK